MITLRTSSKRSERFNEFRSMYIDQQRKLSFCIKTLFSTSLCDLDHEIILIISMKLVDASLPIIISNLPLIRLLKELMIVVFSVCKSCSSDCLCRIPFNINFSDTFKKSITRAWMNRSLKNHAHSLSCHDNKFFSISKRPLQLTSAENHSLSSCTKQIEIDDSFRYSEKSSVRLHFSSLPHSNAK